MERLDLDSQISSWDAAIHIARYATARQLCNQRAVLDVACGEGYGSKKLLEWGAKSVVGLDVSEEAIQRAKNKFPDKNIEFIQMHADLPDFLDQRFDLVVSFETIEHVNDPNQFLVNIKNSMKQDAVAIISCPNDNWYYSNGGSNEFHKHKWDANEFKELIEKHFEHVKLMFGYPSIGFANLSLESHQYKTFDSTSGELEVVSPTEVLDFNDSAYFLAVIGADHGVRPSSANFVSTMTSYFGSEPRSFSTPGDLISKLNHVEKRMTLQDSIILSLSSTKDSGEVVNGQSYEAGIEPMNQDELFAKIMEISKGKDFGLSDNSTVGAAPKKSRLKRSFTSRYKFDGRFFILIAFSVYRKLPRSLRRLVKPFGRKILRMKM